MLKHRPWLNIHRRNLRAMRECEWKGTRSRSSQQSQEKYHMRSHNVIFSLGRDMALWPLIRREVPSLLAQIIGLRSQSHRGYQHHQRFSNYFYCCSNSPTGSPLTKRIFNCSISSSSSGTSSIFLSSKSHYHHFTGQPSFSIHGHPHPLTGQARSRIINHGKDGKGNIFNSRIHLPPPPLSKGASNDVSDSNPIPLPPLMAGDPPAVLPNIINMARNWFFVNLVIRPYMDREFSTEEFVRGAREALTLISSKLSSGDLDGLEDLIEPSAFAEIKRNLATFNMAQREMLRVDVEDIITQFPFEIGIILPERAQRTHYVEGAAPQERQVEILMVFHVLKGFGKEKEEAENPSTNFEGGFPNSADIQRRIMICNYRFFRDFTKGIDPSWTVNLVNHYMMAGF